MATAVLTPAGPLHAVPALKLWHLLSLDAPSVAALWTCFLAHEVFQKQTAAVPAALALAVWLLYAGDRVYDTIRGEDRQERHRFLFQHRGSLYVAAAVVAAALAGLMRWLPPHLRTAWLLLALPLGLYAAAVHLLQVRVPKEPLVAIFFGLATTLPLFASRSAPWGTLAPIAVGFGLVCWLNCAAIARWEATLAEADGCTRWLGRYFPSASPSLVLLTAPLLLLPHTVGIGLSLMASAACLSAVDRLRLRFESTTLRALADLSLLTPLVVWPLLASLKMR
ncbi:MAG: hypothetical protein ACRYF4_14050 [Janthinobacterium lividum]